MKTKHAFWTGFCLSALVSSFLTWAFTADHYGHIYRGDLIAGIMCRVHKLETVRHGSFGDTINLCVDLSDAIPEDQLWDEALALIEENFALRRKLESEKNQ